MKKLILIFIFFLTSLNINYANNIFDDECIDYAFDSTNAEQDAYGQMSEIEYHQTTMYYYNLCVDGGGADNMLDPVFI